MYLLVISLLWSISMRALKRFLAKILLAQRPWYRVWLVTLKGTDTHKPTIQNKSNKLFNFLTSCFYPSPIFVYISRFIGNGSPCIGICVCTDLISSIRIILAWILQLSSYIGCSSGGSSPPFSGFSTSTPSG